MLKRFVVSAFAVVVFAAAARADDFTIDKVHSGVTFKIQHVGLGYIYGRFNDFSGNFAIDADAGKCAFAMNIKADSVDTANAGRDNHLKSPDFFNAKQFPAISFQSTSVKAAKDGYEVTGDVTMHGVTKPVTFTLTGGKTGEFPAGTVRTGFSTDFVLKRSDFEIAPKVNAKMAGDEVYVSISFEGTKKK